MPARVAAKVAQLAAVGSLIGWLLDGAAWAQPPAAASACANCHEAGGVSLNSNIPIIAGHSAFFLVDQLLAFARGDRPCLEMAPPSAPNRSTDMCQIASAMTETEMEEVAAYFAGLPFRGRDQATDSDLVERGRQLHDERCHRCHTEGGSLPEDDAAVLAGQWVPYLKRALTEFISGDRRPPEEMKSKLDGLTESDFNALAHYYASQHSTDDGQSDE